MLAEDPPTRLRRFRPEDLSAFQAYRADPELARYQGWSAMTDAEAAGFLGAVATAPLFSPGQWCQIAVATCADDALIGDMGLCLSEAATEVEIGITLARDHHGTGHALRASRLAVGLVWAHSPASVVRIWTTRENRAARKVIDALGATWTHEEVSTLPDGSTLTEDAFVIERTGGAGTVAS